MCRTLRDLETKSLSQDQREKRMLRQQNQRSAEARGRIAERRGVLSTVDMGRRRVEGSAWRSGRAQAGVLRADIGLAQHTLARSQRAAGYLRQRLSRGRR